MSEGYEKAQAMYQKLLQKKKRRRILGYLLLVMCIAAAAWLFLKTGNSSFEVTFYQLSSEKIKGTVRAVLLSDLHNHVYGVNNEELVGKIKELEPDLILMAGDMVNGDDNDISVVMKLCESLMDIAPIYYGVGNNEGELMYGHGENIELMQYLNEDGIPMVFNSSVSLEVRGNLLEIGGGISSAKDFDPDAQEFIAEFEEKDGYRILINHIPTVFYEKLYDVDVDLAVAGHFHGGLVRLPILGGLYHIEAGLFPKYCSGEFRLGHATLIVSRGLGSNDPIPRVNNKPELVVIDISEG